MHFYSFRYGNKWVLNLGTFIFNDIGDQIGLSWGSSITTVVQPDFTIFQRIYIKYKIYTIAPIWTKKGQHKYAALYLISNILWKTAFNSAILGPVPFKIRSKKNSFSSCVVFPDWGILIPIYAPILITLKQSFFFCAIKMLASFLLIKQSSLTLHNVG